jgi:hypothetical protein
MPKTSEAKRLYNAQYRLKNKEKLSKYEKARNKKRKSYKRNQQYKKNFGITLADYNQLFLNQNGNCAICGKNQSTFNQALAVDHCHKTDKVRGLLCTNCNIAIGLLYEDISSIQSALVYLKK